MVQPHLYVAPGAVEVGAGVDSSRLRLVLALLPNQIRSDLKPEVREKENEKKKGKKNIRAAN